MRIEQRPGAEQTHGKKKSQCKRNWYRSSVATNTSKGKHSGVGKESARQRTWKSRTV
jgi:hypothetical protein